MSRKLPAKSRSPAACSPPARASSRASSRRRKRKPVIEAVARATGRAVDSSVSLGASRQRPVCHETRCRPGADPAPCLRARRHVLLRDLHLANHGQLRPARRPPSRMGSSGWCSPTRPPLLPLLPSISTSVLRALQRAQKLQAQSRNRLGSSRFRLPGHCSNRRSRTQLQVPKADHTVRPRRNAISVPSLGKGQR